MAALWMGNVDSVQDEPRYAPGDARVQVALVLLAVLSIGLFFYLHGIISEALVDVQWLLDSDPQLAIILAGRILLWLVIFSGGIALAIGGYLLVLAARVCRSGCYPPPGMPVAFRTRVKTDGEALRMARACRWVALLLWCQPLLGAFIWFRLTGGAF